MTKTEKNLKAAFAGESEARNRYTWYARIARGEGYHYIAKIFEETATNEMYHALEEITLLKGSPNTAANLKEAVFGEKVESEEMYPRFANEAELEGNKAASILFTQIAKIESEHKKRFEKLLDMVEAGSVFKRDQPIKWKCGVCGYTYKGLEPPNKCPYCKHQKEYYEPANLDV